MWVSWLLVTPHGRSPCPVRAFRFLSDRQSQCWCGQPSPFLIPMPCTQVTHSPGLPRWPNWDFNNCPRPIESGLGLMAVRIKAGVEGFLGEGRHQRASSLIWARLLLSLATGEWKSSLASTESASSISRSDIVGALNGPCSPGPFPDLPSFRISPHQAVQKQAHRQRQRNSNLSSVQHRDVLFSLRLHPGPSHGAHVW